MTVSDLATAARMLRESVKDKSYRAYPLGGEWAAFMRWGRGSWTEATYREYESCGDKFARFFLDLELADFEPPLGTERLEEFLDATWGDKAPGTYNKHVTTLHQFFKFAQLKEKLHGDPSLPLRRRKKRDVHRTIFNEDHTRQILAAGPSDDPKYMHRDRVCLRLLLERGIRKGTLRAIQYKHFDTTRRTLTLFSKGGRVRDMRIGDDAFWADLALTQMALGAQPDHYLLGSRHTFNRFCGYDPVTGEKKIQRIEEDRPEKPLSSTATHHWWYRCLERAGVAAKGQRAGEKMHKARYSAGQALLEETHDIVLVQKLLGHASPATTQAHYVGYDEFQVDDQIQAMLDRRRGV